MGVGLGGIVLDFLPGPPLAWLGLLIYSIGTSFATITFGSIFFSVLLILLIYLLDHYGYKLGLRSKKGSYRLYGFEKEDEATQPINSQFAVFGAIIGGVAGMIWFDLFGLAVGSLLGAFIIEFIHDRSDSHPYKKVWAALVDVFAETLIKMIIIISMAIHLTARAF